MNKEVHFHTPESENHVNPEAMLDRGGEFGVLLFRHSAFEKEKNPQLVDGNTGEVLGPAEVHEGASKEEGYFGPDDDEAIDKAVSIPGLSTEQGKEETTAEGRMLGEALMHENEPTYVLIAASPSRWPNEKNINKNVPHLGGSRTMTTAAALKKGLESAVDGEKVTIGEHIITDESLSEAGYFFNESEDRVYDALQVVSEEIAKVEGQKGNPNQNFIKNHPLVEAMAARYGTRNAKEVTHEITESLENYYSSEAVQDAIKSGKKVLVIGVTHAQVSKSFMYHGSDAPERADQKGGYRDSEAVMLSRETDENGQPHYSFAGWTELE